MIATGILKAMKELEIKVPVVARIQGTNSALGMQMVSYSVTTSSNPQLQEAKAEFENLHPVDGLYEAVVLAIKLGRKEFKSNKPPRERLPPGTRRGQPPQPFSGDHEYLGTSPAFTTRKGNIRPAVMTFAVKGDGVSRTVKTTRPWRRGDPPIDTPQITVKQAAVLTRTRIPGVNPAALRKERRLDRFGEAVIAGGAGPTETFFKE